MRGHGDPMSVEDDGDEYVLRLKEPGPQRMYLLELESKEGAGPHITSCQVCAFKMGRKLAHALHQAHSEFAVIRIRGRRKR